MSREDLLNDLEDLIKTLNSPNYNDPSVKEKWFNKRDQTLKAIKSLPSEDFDWMDAEYRKWFRENYKDKISLDKAGIF
jgi:hypothetical protein